MNIGKLIKFRLLLLVLMLSTSAYAYNKQSALNACINKVTQNYTGQYYRASNVHTSDKGNHSYNLTGNVRSTRDEKTHHFTCNIRHKEVVNWKVNSSHGHKNNAAAAIGVGILALAVAGAIDNHNKKKHKHDRYNDHDSGGNPFSDMRYLKRQCRQNIRHHLQRDHGRVSKISFDSAHLNHRKLRGTGYVEFRNGGERDLNYTCEFDRRGKIYDGHYRYRHRR